MYFFTQFTEVSRCDIEEGSYILQGNILNRWIYIKVPDVFSLWIIIGNFGRFNAGTYYICSANLFFISATLQKYLLISRGLPDGLSL